MTSLSAHCGSNDEPSATTAKRSSILAEPSSMRSSTAVASSGSTSVRNPTRPTFTPNTGIPDTDATRAARRNVPSPPTDSTRSRPSANARAAVSSSASSPASIRVRTPRSSSHAPIARAASAAAGRPGWTTNPAAFIGSFRSRGHPRERAALREGGLHVQCGGLA